MGGAAIDAGDLDRWLGPFLGALGRKTRRVWAPLYLRGLLGPGERKSLQPMAARLGFPGHDQLHHFISSPAWNDAPLWAVLAREADRLVGGPDGVLVIDDTALPKKGVLSVGVARQYCGQPGKKANSDVRRQCPWTWSCSLRRSCGVGRCMTVALRRRQGR